MYDPRDMRGVPVSAGIPLLVRICAAIGVLVVFTIGGLVIYASGYGHAWPYTKSTEIRL